MVATQMRPGMIIKHNSHLHSVFTVEHRTPGQPASLYPGKAAQHSHWRHVRASLPFARSHRARHCG